MLNSSIDLAQIMEMSNSLHSTLSQCIGQAYLMQAELSLIHSLSKEKLPTLL